MTGAGLRFDAQPRIQNTNTTKMELVNKENFFSRLSVVSFALTAFLSMLFVAAAMTSCTPKNGTEPPSADSLSVDIVAVDSMDVDTVADDTIVADSLR